MTKKSYLFTSVLLVSFLLLTACQQPEPTPTVKPQPLTFTVTPDTSKDSQPPKSDENTQDNQCTQNIPDSSLALSKLNSILYVQTSAEYQMAATQSYALATVMLDRGLDRSRTGLQP